MSGGGNSLVAGPVNTTTPFSGLWLIEDGQGIAAGIENGDWLATGMSVVGGVLDAAAAIIDPIGQLLGMGMAWVLDHVAPISDWFKQLTGDAGQVAGFGQTWANVATRMHESGDLLSNRLGDLEGMSGATIDAYRAYAGDFAKHLHMLGDWSRAISTGLQAASTLVQVVHDLIRDILSQLVGTAVSAVVTSAVTLGAGIPVAIAQIGTRLASLLPKATKAIKGLVESFKALQNMIRQLGPIIAKAGKTFSELMPGAPTALKKLVGGEPVARFNPKKPLTREQFDLLPGSDQFRITMGEFGQRYRVFDETTGPKFGGQYWNRYANALTQEQTRAVNWYTMEPPKPNLTYKDYNASLRGQIPSTPSITNDIRLIDEALNGRRVPEPVVVSRNTGIGHLTQEPMDLEGLVINEPGYISSSLGPPPFKDKEAFLHIGVPAGSPGMYVEKVGAYGGGERELLLPRGLSYLVQRVLKTEDGKWHIFAEVVTDE